MEFIDDTDRDLVDQMLNATEYLDLIIPRGGKGLIKLVIDNSSVPTLQTGDGNCHLFVDESANLDDAVNILVNAKTQRIGVCNACETLLVHENIADRFLPMAYEALKDKVELRGDSSTKKIIDVKDASPEDWYEEYLDYILAIKVVRDVDEAIDHINKYGTKHSESIVQRI